MDPVLFGIVFGAAMLYLIVSTLTTKVPEPIHVPVVKAGKVSDFYYKEETLRKKLPQFINVEGERVNISDYVVFYVRGESMRKYKIHDKQLVFMKPMVCIDSIENHPVLVFRITDPEPDDAEYKLRKFVYLIDNLNNVNWAEIYEQNKERINIPKEEFITQCANKANKDKDKLNGKIVLSETFDNKTNKDCYSLHALSTVYGRVDYSA